MKIIGENKREMENRLRIYNWPRQASPEEKKERMEKQ